MRNAVELRAPVIRSLSSVSGKSGKTKMSLGNALELIAKRGSRNEFKKTPIAEPISNNETISEALNRLKEHYDQRGCKLEKSKKTLERRREVLNAITGYYETQLSQIDPLDFNR